MPAYRLLNFDDDKHRHADADYCYAIHERHRTRIENSLHEGRVRKNDLRHRDDCNTCKDGARSEHTLPGKRSAMYVPHAEEIENFHYHERVDDHGTRKLGAEAAIFRLEVHPEGSCDEQCRDEQDAPEQIKRENRLLWRAVGGASCQAPSVRMQGISLGRPLSPC